MGFKMRLLTLWVCRGDSFYFFFSATWGATEKFVSGIFSLALIKYIAQNLHQEQGWGSQMLTPFA